MRATVGFVSATVGNRAVEGSPVDALVAQVLRARALPKPAERRAIRERVGLPTSAIAGAVGVTRQAVCNWEKGIRSPTGVRLERYLRVLQQLRDLEVA